MSAMRKQVGCAVESIGPRGTGRIATIATIPAYVREARLDHLNQLGRSRRPNPADCCSAGAWRIFPRMPTRQEVLQIDGHDVVITNPDKVFFPETGHTKLDLVNYYLAVADGALRGAGGRPMALKRFVNGAAGDFFFQKRAPENRPEWLETVELSFPS